MDERAARRVRHSLPLQTDLWRANDDGFEKPANLGMKKRN